jgi:hypothetical protein
MQDDIPPFPSSEAFAMIEADLGTPAATLFSPLPAAPTAAASLGQVYRTKLVSTGEAVAVKVALPDLHLLQQGGCHSHYFLSNCLCEFSGLLFACTGMSAYGPWFWPLVLAGNEMGLQGPDSWVTIGKR